VNIKLGYGYKEVRYHAHLACLDKIGLSVLPKTPEPLEIDQTWLTGEKGEQVPPIQIQKGPIKADAIVCVCPECDLSFAPPDGMDLEDVTCPGCGYSYKVQPNAL
jgi:hypothetical protein